MFLAVAHGSLEAFMLLVWTFSKNIKIHFLHDVLHITIHNDLIYIADGTRHIATLLSIIDHLCVRLEFSYYLRILYCDNQIISQSFRLTEKFNMTNM